MNEAKEFSLWFLQNVPAFLMSHPIIDFLGFVFGGFALRIIKEFLPN